MRKNSQIRHCILAYRTIKHTRLCFHVCIYLHVQRDRDQTNTSYQMEAVVFNIFDSNQIPLAPPAAGISAETRESRFLEYEVTVDTAALNYLPPTNRKPSCLLLSSNQLAGSQTYLQTCNCMCWGSLTESSELHVYMWTIRAELCCVSLLLKNVDFTCVLAPSCNTVLTSAVGEAANPTQKHGSDLCVQGEEDYQRRSLLLLSLCTYITRWFEFSCSSEVWVALVFFEEKYLSKY